MPEFKIFLLNEQQQYLAQQVGDILTALQTLQHDGAHLGNRGTADAANRIVNQIRQLLGGRWHREESKYLTRLQAVGVHLADAADNGTPMAEVVAGAAAELEALVAAMGQPINQIGADGSVR
jgi:hypothetical protein